VTPSKSAVSPIGRRLGRRVGGSALSPAFKEPCGSLGLGTFSLHQRQVGAGYLHRAALER
jgi:hypothetical protein